MVGLQEEPPVAHHHFARTLASGVLALAALVAACDKMPTTPTPAAPAPSIAAAPPSAATLTVTGVSPTSGPTNPSQIRVTGTGFLNAVTLTLDGVAASVIAVTSTTITAVTPAHSSGTVDVVVTNPGGPSVTLAGAYRFEVASVSLRASPSLVTAGDDITLNWEGPSGRGCLGGGDWIAMYKVGDPDNTGAANGHSDLWFVHV